MAIMYRADLVYKSSLSSRYLSSKPCLEWTEELQVLVASKSKPSAIRNAPNGLIGAFWNYKRDSSSRLAFCSKSYHSYAQNIGSCVKSCPFNHPAPEKYAPVASRIFVYPYALPTCVFPRASTPRKIGRLSQVRDPIVPGMTKRA